MQGVATEIRFLLLAIVCAGVATVFDLRSRRIPNWLTASTALSGLLLHVALGGPNGLGSALLGAALGFGATLIFFLMGGMGAGDVKLTAAVGAVLGLSAMIPALLASAIFGALCGIAVALARGRFREVAINAFRLAEHHRTEGLVPHPQINVQSENGLRLPFALPIALGCLAALAAQLWGG